MVVEVKWMPEDCGGLKSVVVWELDTLGDQIFNPGSPCQVVIPGVAC